MASSSNSYNVISVYLDDTNYPIWFFQMQHHLRGQGLLKFVDGTHLCPSPTPDGVSNECSAREKWFEHDSFVISMISSTLSPEALTLTIGCQSSMEVWLTLKNRYASISVSDIMQLKFSLYHIQKGYDSIEKYLLRFKIVRDKLAIVGVQIPDEEIKFLILAGLPCEYGHTRQIIRSIDHISLKEVRALLLSAEFELELKHKPSSMSHIETMVPQYGSHNYVKLGMPSITQYQCLYDCGICGYMNGNPVSPCMPMSTTAQSYNYAPNYVNRCPMSFGVFSNMNGAIQMNHLSHNGNPTFATTQLGSISPSNTLFASFGISNGPTSEICGEQNNVIAHDSSQFINSASKSRYLHDNGYYQNNAGNVINNADLLLSSSTYQTKGRENQSVSDDLKLDSACSYVETDTLSGLPIVDNFSTVNMVDQSQVQVDGMINSDLISHSGVGTIFCSPLHSLYSTTRTLNCEAKQGSIKTKAGECTSIIKKSAGTISCDVIGSRIASICRGITGSNVGAKSSSSSNMFSNETCKPKKESDSRWESILAVRDLSIL